MRKGQFFLVGAFSLAILFFVGISSQISPEGIVFPEIRAVSSLFDNVRNEYPRAANLGLNESEPVGRLTNFTNFVESKTKERGIEFSLLFVLTQNVSDNLNVTVGNFLGYPIDIELNVSGAVENLQVSDGGTDSNLFSNPPETFSLGISFNTTEKNLLLEKRKANLYFILDMRKGDNIIKGEVVS